MCVCVLPLQSASALRTAPPENTGMTLQTLRTTSIHLHTPPPFNGEEMGKIKWMGSKLSALIKEDTIFIIAFSQGSWEDWNGKGVCVFCTGHPRWSALTCTNLLYPVLFSYSSHLSCTLSSRDLPGN